MTKQQGIWAVSISSAAVILYWLYIAFLSPILFKQTNAIGGIYECSALMNDNNITAIESFLSEVNATIKQGKVSDILLSASLPVKTDPTQGSGESLETCVEALTNHLNGLKIQQSYQQ